MAASTDSSAPSAGGLPDSTSPTQRIAIIIGSTRTPSVGPRITSFVASVLRSRLPAAHIQLEVLSLPLLPLFAEPIIPAMLDASNPTPGYTLPASRVWSETVASYQGFVFVTPQYNWGIPAALKNALDYLYFEWNGKPAMVVSYGNRGGDKAALMLKTVLTGLRMKVEEQTVQLVLGESSKPAMMKGELADGQQDLWLEQGAGDLLEKAAKSCFQV